MKLFSFQRDFDHPYPPRITKFTTPFWNGLANARFLTTRCRACDAKTFPPKIVCPQCWSGDVEWIEPETTGVLYSWTRVHAAPAVFRDIAPYTLGVVDLDSGIRLACPVIADAHIVECGMKIELARLAYRNGHQLVARPVDT